MSTRSKLFKNAGKGAAINIRTACAGLLASTLLASALLTGCAAQNSNASSGAEGSSASTSASAQTAAADNGADAAAISATVSIEFPVNANGEGADARESDATSANIESYAVELAEDQATVLGALETTGVSYSVENSQYGAYITAIGDVTAEGSSGWVYTVNGEQVMESADVCQLSDGDSVEFSYITM